MRYYLTISQRDGTRIPISGFWKAQKFKNRDETRLEEIDRFTASFLDETTLKLFLLDKGLVETKFAKGTLEIISCCDEDECDITILPYGIFYQHDINFLNYEFFVSYFCFRMYNKDFMQLFLDTYERKLKDTELCFVIYDMRNYYNIFLETDTLPPEAHLCMESFIKKFCFQNNKDGKPIREYSKFRELAMFGCHFDHSQMTKIEDNTIPTLVNLMLQLEQINYLLRTGEYTDEEEQTYDSQVLELSRKIREIRGGFKLCNYQQ